MNLVKVLILIIVLGLFILGACAIIFPMKKKHSTQNSGGNSQIVNYEGNEDVGGSHSHHHEMIEQEEVDPNDNDDPKPSEILD